MNAAKLKYPKTGHLYLPFPTEWNETEYNRQNLTDREGNFYCDPSKKAKSCNYPLRSKVDFQAECFKLLAIGSVPSKKNPLRWCWYDDMDNCQHNWPGKVANYC
uniref:Uncharacterized protein n=1 Tax=Romanomermis culicivorax TaxID=13658 RepID=A0A915L7R3_ROMCU